MSYQKKLDLKDSGVNVQITDVEKEALKAQAAKEYDDDVDLTFNEVVKEAEEFEETSGIPLKIDGKYNPEWDAAWNKAHREFSTKRYDSFYKISKARSGRYEKYYEFFEGDSVNEIRVYLRFRLMSYLEPANAKGLTTYDQWKQFVVENGRTGIGWGVINNEYTDKRNWTNVGTTEWFERCYDFFKMDTEDSEVNSIAAELRQNYIDARYTRLITDLLNEKLNGALSGVSFDFYVNKVPESKASDYGIGSEYTSSGSTIKVAAGSFAADDSGKEPEKVFLSTVDFGGSSQFYDPELTEKRAAAASSDGAARDSANTTLYKNIGYRDLGTYIMLFDGGSLEQTSTPYLAAAGNVTKLNKYVLWPYESASKPYRGGYWNAESLTGYGVFNVRRKNGKTGAFSYVDEMQVTGLTQFTRSGYDICFPEFDSSGNLVSISKPLMNGLVDVDTYAAKSAELDKLDDEYEAKKEEVYPHTDYDWSDLSYGKFDGKHLIRQLADAGDNTIRRYIITEDTKGTKLNGRLASDDTKELILDVVPSGQIMVFSSAEEADAFYGNYDFSRRFAQTDNSKAAIPYAVYNNSTKAEEPEPEVTPDPEPDPQPEPETDMDILVTLDGYDADTSLVDQSDMTKYSLTLYSAAEQDGSMDAFDTGENVIPSFIKGSEVATLPVSRDGKASLSGIKPGKYVLVETANPDGTRRVKDQYNVEIKDNGGKAEVWVDGRKIADDEYIEVANEISKLKVEKKDGGGKAVKGAELSITDTRTGETVDSWTTDGKPHTVAGLSFDSKYELTENKAPAGYVKADDVTFGITDANVKAITMIDEKIVKPHYNKDKDDSKKDSTAAKKTDAKTKTQSRGPLPYIIRTGDSGAIYAAAALFICAAAALIAVLIMRRKKAGK
ncbi:MAG: collagen binding domain-containing protein [Anaerovoracaceae bacterium]